MAIYEKLAEDKIAPAAEDRFLLGQLYRGSGDWTKARRQLLALLTTQGNQPQYVTAYARGLLERKEFAEAEQWINRLEGLSPMVCRQRNFAEVQFRTGKVDEALATWTKFIGKARVAQSHGWHACGPPPPNWKHWERGRATWRARQPLPRQERSPNRSFASVSRRIQSRAWSWSGFSDDKNGSMKP